MRILFISSYDPRDNKSWSGTPIRMLNALESKGVNVTVLGPYKSKVKTLLKYLSYVFKKSLGIRYNYAHSILCSIEYKIIFEYRIKKLKGEFDYIFCPAGATEIAFINTDIPIIYTSDATFNSISSYYSDFSDLLSFSKAESDFIESKALVKSEFITYPSLWAENSALSDYKVDKSKLFQIPWGANFDYINHLQVNKCIDSKGKIKVLFVGVDWERKGGGVVYNCCKTLIEEYGYDIELIVCGCTPLNTNNEAWITKLGRLNKNIESENEILKEQYISSHFIFVPSKNECYGMVFCEAAAYSLPVISRNTGGIESVVEDGKNGFLLPDNASISDYIDKILLLIENKELYHSFSINSRTLYENKLNWDKWSENFLNKIGGAN